MTPRETEGNALAGFFVALYLAAKFWAWILLLAFVITHW